jgi:competence protein ComEC
VYAHALNTPSALWCFIAAVAIATLSGLSASRFAAPILAAALFAFALGWYDLRVNQPRQSPLWHQLTTDPPALLTVDATVLDTPQFIPRPHDGLAPFRIHEAHSRFSIRTSSASTETGQLPFAADLWVRLNGSTPLTLRAGDRIHISGRYHPVAGPRNPGDQDPRDYAAEQGFLGTLSIDSPGVITTDDTPASLTTRLFGAYRASLDTIAARARAVLTKAAGDSDQARALLLGLILGDFDPAQQSIRDSFARQGLAHVLSISGLHLSVMALVLLTLLRLTGDRGWLEPALVALLVLGYLAIVPPNSPVVRSAVMILALLVAEAAGRRYDRLTILLWIGVGLLLWRPLDVFAIGFQLSLGLTACLFWLGSRALAHLFGRPVRGVVRTQPTLRARLSDTLKLALTCGCLCWSASLPTTLYALGYLSPWSLAATILVTPLIVAMLWVGYVALWLGMVWPTLAAPAATIIQTLSYAAIQSVRALDSLPGATIYLPPLSGWWAAASTTCVLLAWRVARPRRAWWWCVVLLPLAWAGAEWTLQASPSPLTINTFDVGDGSCHLLRSGPDALLWDSGAIGDGRLMNPTVRACRAAGAWRVPVAVITHPDIDHFGAILDIARPLGIRRVLVPPRFLSQATSEPRGAAGIAVAALTARGIDIAPIIAGDELALGSTHLKFISPPPGAPWTNDNDHSLIAILTAPTSRGNATVLLTGDAQDAALANAGTMLPPGFHPDILELPHHGSARPAAISFVAALRPGLIIQSTGLRRVRDPRWSAVREGSLWMCTAERGAISTQITPGGTILTQGYLDPAPLRRMVTPTTTPAGSSPF